MTDSLSGHFLRICHSKRQVSAQPSGLRGGLTEFCVMICGNVLTNTLLLLVSLNAQTVITSQKEKSMNSVSRSYQVTPDISFHLIRTNFRLKVTKQDKSFFFSKSEQIV